MLLTLKPTTAQHAIGGSPHDFSQAAPSHSSSPSRYPSIVTASSPSASSASAPALLASDLTQARMATPHRGLPPPPGMTLPPPAPSPHAASMPVDRSLMTLPAPPDSWGREENMRNWLQAKAEEDRRKQEEEKTRQEGLKLEQRKIEHSILHESLQGGIPPPMVPIVFAGMAGANIPMETTIGWAHHYMNELNIRNQQEAANLAAAQQSGTLPSSNPYKYVPSAPAPSQPVQAAPPAQQNSTFLPPYSQPSTRPRSDTGPAAAVSTPRTDQGRLPRINTTEMPNTQPIPALSAAQLAGQPLHPIPPSQASQQQAAPISQPPSGPAQESSQSSPNNIFFYHWQPPNSQAPGSSNQPTTPSGNFTKS
jgi:hypothetical protein